jgi:hypothetical protein
VSGPSFDDLVAVAALGVSRKGFAAAALDGPAGGYAGVLDSGDPAAALLDAAALLTVAGRAGVRPQRETAPPPATGAVSADGERELSARGARLLARIGGLDRERGLARDGAELLKDLLIAMRAAGYVLAAPLLPGLLDVASRTPALRPAVGSVLGARGRWLAGHRADWQQVAGAVLAGQAGTGMADGAGAGDGDPPEVWQVGGPAERRAYLVSLRGRDPRGGRELLADGWSREPKDERASLLAVLARGLSVDDEEFLETALDDRAGEVREVARQLLSRLPGSAFRRRAADRAAGVLRLEGGGPGARLVARVPDDLDRTAIRDGIQLSSLLGLVDDTVWRFSQLIAGVPLSDWTARFGLTPGELVALPVEGVAAIEVRAGWRLAASRQAAARQADTSRDAVNPELADWALELLSADRGVVNRPSSVWAPDVVLADLLPGDLRAVWAAVMLADVSADARPPQVQSVRSELASHPVPWSPVLADAVLAALARGVPRPALTEFTHAVLDTAGRGMPATGARDYAAELTRLADSMPQAWLPDVLAAAETITLRRAFLAELS